MKATVISMPWRANALALALGLAIIGLGGGLAHSNPARVSARPSIAQVFHPQAGAPDFVCHAPPGAWCDLRGTSAYDHSAPRASALDNLP